MIHEHGSEDHNSFEALRLALQAIEESEDLKETLRAGFMGVASLLQITGFLRADQVPAPSANGLERLLRIVESTGERALRSKSCLSPLYKTAKATEAA